MQAIILAAGMGRRLKEYTSDNTFFAFYYRLYAKLAIPFFVMV